MESSTDQLSLFIENDQQAFLCLYQQYAPALYGVILEGTADTKLARDIMIESFAEAWLNLPAFDTSKSSLFTWLLRITLKQCRMVLCLPVNWYISNCRNFQYG